MNHCQMHFHYSKAVKVLNIPKFLLNDANLQQTLMINNARFHKSCLNKHFCSRREFSNKRINNSGTKEAMKMGFDG